MMKKRPVSQADQVPQNEDSATPKQLVLVRAERKSSLGHFLFCCIKPQLLCLAAQTPVI